jgi:hypothetical protein
VLTCKVALWLKTPNQDMNNTLNKVVHLAN